jgi:hypothetical protein
MGKFVIRNTNIGEKFELKDKPPLDSKFTRLGISGSLVGRTLEVCVTETSTSTFDEDFLFTSFENFKQNLTCLSIFGYSAKWNIQVDVFTIGTFAEASAARFTVVSFDVFAVFEVDEGPVLWVSPQNDMTSTSTVTAVRTTFGYKLFATKVHRAVSAIT